MADLLPDKHGVPRFKFRIQRVGIEIEGAWKVKVADPTTGLRAGYDTPLFPDGTAIKADPSVKFAHAVGLAAIGEVVSEPLIRPALWQWIRAHYPDVTNRTCGIHVHMSLRHDLDYQRLIDRRFHDHLLLGLHRWGLTQHLAADHVFWPRIRGCNLFAQDVFHGDYQARYGGDAGRGFHDNRYGMINYCWKLHKTFEVRVLPTFADKKTAIRAVRRVLNLTEEYLAQARTVKEIEQSVLVRMSDYRPSAVGLPIRIAHTADEVDGIAVAYDVGMIPWQGNLQAYTPSPDAFKGLISRGDLSHWLAVTAAPPTLTAADKFAKYYVETAAIPDRPGPVPAWDGLTAGAVNFVAGWTQGNNANDMGAFTAEIARQQEIDRQRRRQGVTERMRAAAIAVARRERGQVVRPFPEPDAIPPDFDEIDE